MHETSKPGSHYCEVPRVKHMFSDIYIFSNVVPPEVVDIVNEVCAGVIA